EESVRSPGGTPIASRAWTPDAIAPGGSCSRYPSASAQNADRAAGSAQSNVICTSRAMSPHLLVPVEVADQADLGQVVDQLPVDVQHQPRHGVLGEGPLGLAARAGEPGLAARLHPRLPSRVLRVELGQ